MGGTKKRNVTLLEQAMESLYETCFEDAQDAARRGAAIRAIDALYAEMTGKSYAALLDDERTGAL